MTEKMMKQMECDMASESNAIEADYLYSEWNTLNRLVGRPNSNKTKPKIVRTLPVKYNSTSVTNRLIREIVPSKDEIVFDILIPAFRRSIMSAFLR